MPDPLIGQTLGGYTIEKRLGQGGMAVVYLARPAGHRAEPVALKVLRPEHTNKPAMLQRFLQEAQTLARLQHPHLLPVYNAGQSGGHYYIAMAYMAGGDLKERLAGYLSRGYGLTMQEALSVAIQAAAGLGYAHRHRLVHRDVKPSNMLLTGSGQIRLADFGLALVRIGERSAPGKLAGTVAYMAPEQVRSADQVDHRADIYALGVVLYELLAGRLPFSGDNDLSQLRERVYETPLPLERFNRETPAGVRKIVEQALARRPEERYQSMAAMQADLEKALARLKPSLAELRPAANGQGKPAPGPVDERKLIAMPDPGQAKRPHPPSPETGDRGRSLPLPHNWLIILAGLVLAVGGLLLVAGGGRPATGTPAAGRGQAVEASQTPTPRASPSPAPAGTATRIPSPTRRPVRATASPTPTRPRVTSTPVMTSPSLLAPASNEMIYVGKLTEFRWAWPGQLADNTGFEIRIWRQGSEEDHPGAYDAKDTQHLLTSPAEGVYQAAFDVGAASSVQQNRGQVHYMWTVAVVRLEPYARLGPEASPRPVLIGVDTP